MKDTRLGTPATRASILETLLKRGYAERQGTKIADTPAGDALIEQAGKALTDEDLRAAMKDTGLGTPATRASIIETLLKRGYIAREKNHLIATPLGESLIAQIPLASLASAELTGQWEARLAA